MQSITHKTHQDGLQKFLGFAFESCSPDEVTITWPVSAAAQQRHGIVHGGAYCAVVEAAASRGAALWWGERGTVVGISNQTDFIGAVRGGTIAAIATPVHRGRTQQLWRVVLSVDDRLVALGQVRLQNIPARPDGPATSPPI